MEPNVVNKIKTTEPHCKHFVRRKKRFCRMTLSKGYDYCGEHLPKTEDTFKSTGSRIRIPCPLDRTHTCFASKLVKHLKICNAKEGPQPPYIIKNINTGDQTIENESKTKRNLTTTPVIQLLEVINKVNRLYEDLIKNRITTNILQNDNLFNEINNPEYGAQTKKHLVQISSLIGHLFNANLIQPKTCYVEFGAGKGQLSVWISKATNSVPDTSVLLVERASLRHKLDNKLDKSEVNVHRIRADIAHLALNKVEIVGKSDNIVGVTKHLCGGATDLALRCIASSLKEKSNILGLVMAFCCHHQCFWPTYVGKQFFEKNQLFETDFDIICGLVSWATCGTGKSREHRLNAEVNQETNVENQETNEENNQAKTRDAEIGLSREERELVGKKCKLMIDYGRLCYLQELKFHCQLFYYVEQNVTLENVCLVAHKI